MPAFRAPSVLEFEVGETYASILLIVPASTSATARLSGFEIFESMPAELAERLASEAIALCPHQLPDLFTNSRDGIAVRYRLFNSSGSAGFDTFNPDRESGRVHCAWIEAALGIARATLVDSRVQHYLAQVQSHFEL